MRLPSAFTINIFSGNFSDDLSSLVPILYEFKSSTELADSSHQFAVRYNHRFYVNSFFARNTVM